MPVPQPAPAPAAAAGVLHRARLRGLVRESKSQNARRPARSATAAPHAGICRKQPLHAVASAASASAALSPAPCAALGTTDPAIAAARPRLPLSASTALPTFVRPRDILHRQAAPMPRPPPPDAGASGEPAGRLARRCLHDRWPGSWGGTHSSQTGGQARRQLNIFKYWGRNLTVAEGGGPRPGVAARTLRLQWGRNLTVAEGVVGAEWESVLAELQWGRNLTVAEGARSSRRAWTGSSFNGAAT